MSAVNIVLYHDGTQVIFMPCVILKGQMKRKSKVVLNDRFCIMFYPKGKNGGHGMQCF